MTEQRKETIACIQIEVSRICQLVEIKEWLVAPQIGVEGHYMPDAHNLYNKLLIEAGLPELVEEWQDPEEILLEKCELETDRICTMLDIVQYLWDRGH